MNNPFHLGVRDFDGLVADCGYHVAVVGVVAVAFVVALDGGCVDGTLASVVACSAAAAAAAAAAVVPAAASQSATSELFVPSVSPT